MKINKVLMVGLVVIGVIGLIDFVSAATCTKNAQGLCVSCTQTTLTVTLTGYNYNDPVIPRDAFTRDYFQNEQDARSKLSSWGYYQTCARGTLQPSGGGDAKYDFTKDLGSCKKNRYQTQIRNDWKRIKFSQGPEPNPCISYECGSLIAILDWHVHCEDDCIRVGYCSVGQGIPI